MDIEEYQKKVIELFRSGKATDEQYREMAHAVLAMSEEWALETREIDIAVGATTESDYE